MRLLDGAVCSFRRCPLSLDLGSSNQPTPGGLLPPPLNLVFEQPGRGEPEFVIPPIPVSERLLGSLGRPAELVGGDSLLGQLEVAVAVGALEPHLDAHGPASIG